MALTVTIVRSPGQAGGELRQVSAAAWTIGRGAQCDWVLPDPQRSLSRAHCRLEQAGAGWQVRDMSSNGTFVNGEADAIGADRVRALRDGDHLRLGDYELEVRLRQPEAPPPPVNPFGAGAGAGAAEPFFERGANPFASPAPDHFVSPFGSPANGPLPGQASSPNADPYGFGSATPHATPYATPYGAPPGSLGSPGSPGFGAAPSSPAPVGGFGGVRLPGLDDPVLPFGSQRRQGPAPAAMPDHSPAASDAFIPPAVVPGSGAASAAPDDWFRSALIGKPSGAARPATAVDAPAAPLPAPAIPAPRLEAADIPLSIANPTPASADATLAALAMLMQAGGLPPDTIHRAASDPQASLRQAGAVLLAAVAGMRALLVARGLVKREFRIEQTLLRPKENNPLKFAASDEHALASLLDPRTRGLQAVREAVEDLTAHEVAVLAATQAAARSMLESLSPTLMEAQDDGGGLLPGATEKRLWQSYKRRHAKLLEQLEDDFESAFGRAFAKAYEQALRSADKS